MCVCVCVCVLCLHLYIYISGWGECQKSIFAKIIFVHLREICTNVAV